VGGVGIAPGANFGDSEVIFESIHGSAPKYANRDMANPGALMLTGEMLLRFIGWHEAADRLRRGLEDTILQRRVTQDLARRMTGAAVLKCSEFGKALEVNMQ
jgi:isocitrate dehydrogenase